MIDNSLLDKTTNENGRMVNDGTGLSKGMFGDMFKLAGGRFLRDAKGCSILGCDQSGPGFIGSM